MARMMFVNLPVTDLKRSIAFYEAVGFTNNPQFTNDQAACMVWSDTLFVMLLTHDFWKSFTTKALPDPKTHCLAMLCLTHDSREEVDAMVRKATAAGGTPEPTPTHDHGFMYGSSFEDPDGHMWENTWMDPAFASGEQAPEMAQ